jgi:CubicO group peptidase (beta-lactamase class C family)
MKSAIDIFAEGARDGVYPGGQLAISRECQRLVNASVGVIEPDGRATSTETLYDLASLTKPLATSVLVGRALERNLAKLGDPIANYVPGVDPRITLEHALEHATGHPAHRRFDLNVPQDIRPRSWDAWRHVVFQATAEPLEVPPGTRSLYSDIGFILLGAALEVIFGQPLSTSFALLGCSLLYRDRRGPPSLPAPPWAAGIAPTEGCPPGVVHDENARAMGGVAGHAGLFGTAEAVLELSQQLVLAWHGWRRGVLLPETVRLLFAARTGIPGSTRTLGWDRPSLEGSSTGGRWPLTSVGHLGFTGPSPTRNHSLDAGR